MKQKRSKQALSVITILLSIYALCKIYKLDILPTKYFIVCIFLFFLLNGIGILCCFSKKKVISIIGIILLLFHIPFSFFCATYSTITSDFLNNAFNNNVVEISKYNVIVLKDSNYNELKDIEKQSVGALKESKEALEKLQTKITINAEEYEDLYSLYENLIDKKVDALLIDEAYIDVLLEDYPDLEDQIKEIYSFEIETKIKKKEEKAEQRPINIYISGSDSRSNQIQNKSRSDVNMIVTINPKTHRILLTSIPRDYYVQVHGQTGLKDKLTHAGIYGLDISTKTVEDLFDISIDYSVKIGMNAVVEVVDLVDGIDIDSDRTFNSYHIKNWVVKEGINHFNGEQALAYARERYAYASGDRHRIQNQQQVLEAVLKKVLSDKTLLLKYESLLTSLNNLYRTDISKEVITAYVKEQLNTMSNWTFETQWVDGKGASLNTHTAPQYKRYVMIPNEEDVTIASQRIKKIMND